MKIYSLRKSRKILRHAFKLFQKKRHRLTETDHRTFEADLRALDLAVLSKRKEEASTIAQRVEIFAKTHFPKTFFDHLLEIFYALLFAIVVAFFIRQFWFSLYKVPTGSMRPTIEELDRLFVSKTPFGINFPFIKRPLLFSDDYVQRGGIIVFTVAGMDVADQKMLYFGIFPGYKQLVKRCLAKPGDTIYFYGGQIYGVDREGNPILEFADSTFLQKYGLEKIDHVPYMVFDGKSALSRPLSHNLYGSVTLKQMNLPVGRMQVMRGGEIEGSFYNGKSWVPDRVNALKAPHETPVSYSDLWGIGNYAMARLLTKEQAAKFYGPVPNNKDALLYLELRHTPNLTYPKPTVRQDESGHFQPMITPFATVVPLKRPHLDTLQKSLYTARFFVKNGRAYRYTERRGRPQRVEFDPVFPHVPNGCYEFYYGVGYKVLPTGIRKELPPDHPLYSTTPANIQKLFNLGTMFNTLFAPMAANQTFNPQRYVYFREGDLYVMGAPILKKNDPTLLRFVQSELEKQEKSSREAPYIAFVDHGPPMKDGQLDIPFIKAFGLKVDEGGVVGLGDNYAMSADSRDFGFVPTENLRGAPSFTFWPPSSRIGSLPQPPYPWVTLPNVIIWSLVVIVIVGCCLYAYRRNQKSLFG